MKFNVGDRVRVLSHISNAEGEVYNVFLEKDVPTLYNVSLDNGGVATKCREEDLEFVRSPGSRG